MINYLTELLSGSVKKDEDIRARLIPYRNQIRKTNEMGSRLELYYREAFEQGLVADSTHPNKIFGKGRDFFIRPSPNSLEEDLVSNFEPDSYLRRQWHYKMATRTGKKWIWCLAYGGLFGALAAHIFTGFNFTSRNLVLHSEIAGATLGGIVAYFKNVKTKLGPNFVANVEEEPLDLSKFRTDLSKLEAPLDVVVDGNISYGRRYLESKNEVSS